MTWGPGRSDNPMPWSTLSSKSETKNWLSVLPARCKDAELKETERDVQWRGTGSLGNSLPSSSRLVLVACLLVSVVGYWLLISVWVVGKGVGPGPTLAWPGWKQPDIPVEVDTGRLETDVGMQEF
jgi:hypothetical protein